MAKGVQLVANAQKLRLPHAAHEIPETTFATPPTAGKALGKALGKASVK